jgi:protein O-mannosyl-transferase
MSRVDRRAAAACSVAAILGGLVYVNALRNPFVYDDHHTVVENGSIARLSDLRAIVAGAVTRPLVNFSYALDRAVWGPAPLGFHVTNVALHVVAVSLLFVLSRRLGLGVMAAFVAATVFAVHPMMTEAVGYVSGRSELVCATFFMLALLCGRRWLQAASGSDDRGATARGGVVVASDAGRHRRFWGAATAAAWVAALAAKESAAMFPFVFLVYDCVGGFSERDRRRRLRRIHLPLLAVAVVAGIARLVILARYEAAGQAVVHWNYVLLEIDVARRYLWMLINPSRQTIFHAVPAPALLAWQTWLSLATVSLVLFVSWRLRNRAWPVSFGLVWFVLALVPAAALNVLDQGEPMAEHRVYLASCGLFLAVGAGFDWLRERASHDSALTRFAGVAAVALVVPALAAQTVVRNAIWSDPIALWQEAVDLAPGHYRPRLLLGEALQDAGRRHDAIEQFQKAVDLKPTEPLGYVKLGQCLAEVGRWKEARGHFLHAIELDPRSAPARNALLVLDHVESRLGIDARR